MFASKSLAAAHMCLSALFPRPSKIIKSAQSGRSGMLYEVVEVSITQSVPLEQGTELKTGGTAFLFIGLSEG